jgi:hypothetical protein
MSNQARWNRWATVALMGTLATAACAQQGQRGGSGSAPASTQGHDMGTMQGMSMEQQMEHCRQMQGMDRAQMDAEAQRMMEQCDAMMRAHGGAARTP